MAFTPRVLKRGPMKRVVMQLRCILVLFLASGDMALAADMPAEEQQFLSIISDFAQKYEAAPNDMAKGALRPQRAKAICAQLKNLKVKDWVGTLKILSSNNDGMGIIIVALNDRTTVTTWNNSFLFSDIRDKTVIQPGTALHDAAVRLSEGQQIIFSGRFIAWKTDCVREGSLSMSGSMREPEWMFRFGTVQGTNAAPVQQQETAAPVTTKGVDGQVKRVAEQIALAFSIHDLCPTEYTSAFIRSTDNILRYIAESNVRVDDVVEALNKKFANDERLEELGEGHKRNADQKKAACEEIIKRVGPDGRDARGLLVRSSAGKQP